MFCALFTMATFAGLVLLGFAVGAFGTLVGAGRGFILTPVLLILYPMESAATVYRNQSVRGLLECCLGLSCLRAWWKQRRRR
jgi:uncharacterized membrane protein YfcA